MKKIFQDPKYPASFGGVNALFRAANGKISKKEIKEWLRSQEAYTLHKPARRRFKTNRVIVGHINQQFQTDLADIRLLRKENDGYNYILTCIDILSKYAWAIPIKAKTGQIITNAFKRIFKERKPKVLQSDSGTEFKNVLFQKFLKDNKVHFFTTESDKKASVIERFNRTLKTKMWKYFTHYNTKRYIDVLDRLVHSYNHTWHSSIKMNPAEVNEENQDEVWKTLYRDLGEKIKKFKFNEGDSVRVSKLKMVFEKGYEKNWTREIFFISERVNRQRHVYRIKDAGGEMIQGTFYEEELQKVEKPDYYQVEKILRTRKVKGKTEYFVKFKDYPSKFNTWVSDLKKI